MKTFSASFSVALLLTCPFVSSMGSHQKSMYMQQQEQQNTYCSLTNNNTLPYTSQHESNPQSNYLNHQGRRNITRDINRACALEDMQRKLVVLQTIQEKLIYLKTIVPEKNQVWLDEQLQKIKALLVNTCQYTSEPKPQTESAGLPNMSQTVLLEREFFTRTHKIAQEETQLNQTKREAKQYQAAYKERLLQKQELLAQNVEAIAREEQKQHAAFLKIQQALNTTQLQKQEFEQLLHKVQSSITVINNYAPQSVESVSAPEQQVSPTAEKAIDEKAIIEQTDRHYCNEPTDDIQLELPMTYDKQTNTKSSQLSHSCNMQ